MGNDVTRANDDEQQPLEPDASDGCFSGYYSPRERTRTREPFMFSGGGASTGMIAALSVLFVVGMFAIIWVMNR